MSPFRLALLLAKDFDKGNPQYPDNLIIGEDVSVSDLEGDVFRFVRHLCTNFKALVPFWVKTLHN